MTVLSRPMRPSKVLLLLASLGVAQNSITAFRLQKGESTEKLNSADFAYLSDDSASDQEPAAAAAADEETGEEVRVQEIANLTGDYIQDASLQYNQNEPVVAFSFNKEGSDLFAKMTSENVGSRFAIVLD